jgi:hypothetical protein
MRQAEQRHELERAQRPEIEMDWLTNVTMIKMPKVNLCNTWTLLFLWLIFSELLRFPTLLQPAVDSN